VSGVDGHGFEFEGPDTFEDRLAVIVRLIDTADNDLDEVRRRKRQGVALVLLARLAHESNRKVVQQLDRLTFT
jgi:hypothetical protein